ncbi:MAG: hypothetical protein CL930_01350 [Deltaproteobacteria bacterium]|nr:hypothetical protein [Deltaproteobacteria bacterium]
MSLARDAKHIWVSKGKKLIKFDLSNDVSDEEIARVILGRSGTLRAPAIRAGDTFLVGFHPEGYTEIFG